MRKLFLLTLALSAALINAQSPVRGTIDIAFGWVKQADGTKKSLKGLKLNYIAHPIQAVPLRPVGNAERLSAFTKLMRPVLNPMTGSGAGRTGPLAADVQIYKNESTTEVGGIMDPSEFANPSSLDDLILSSNGINKLWKRLRFGVHVQAPTSHEILIRWRVFDTSVENPAGQMDYADEIADVGGTFTPQDPSMGATWIYEVPDFQVAGIVVPDGECYFAQQFRDTSDLVNGEGPFEMDYYQVYNKDTLPQIGSSSDGFIFDSDFLDGIYENGVNPGEFDIFSTTPPPFGNLLLGIWANSTSQAGAGIPVGVSTSYGIFQSGNVFSLFFDDTNTYNVRESFTGSRVDPHMGIDVVGALPTEAPLSFRIQAKAVITGQAALVKTFMWRFSGGTPGWVLLNTRNSLANVPFMIDSLYGGTIPLANFVGPGGEARVRITATRSPSGDRTIAVMKTNLVTWVVTY